MTEDQAREALLIRAFDRQPSDPVWSEEDRRYVSQEALRRIGPQASPEQFIAERARQGVARLARRQPRLPGVIEALQWRSWIGPFVLLLALASGLVLDAAGAGQRINILNPPLLLILAWNLLSYLVLGFNALWPGQGRIRNRGLSSLLVRLATGQGWRGQSGAGGPADSTAPARPNPATLARFRASWFQAAAPLYGQRALSLLHGGAMLFALGALSGLYLRGLAFEYRAGWESTFLGPEQVHSLLGMLWGPASLLSGIALPDASRLAELRFPDHPGENAAPWIHLQTLTMLLLVVVPRLCLAIWHQLRARQLARHFPLPLHEPYFRDLQRQQRGESAIVWVQPYSYTLSAASQDGLKRLLGLTLGSDTRTRLQPPVSLGEEDLLAAPLPGLNGSTMAVALFSLSATPEAENHATFLEILRQLLPAEMPLAVLVDETAFRARFSQDSSRIDSRRAAWQRILATHSDIEPIFASLGEADQAQEMTVQQLQSRLAPQAALA